MTDSHEDRFIRATSYVLGELSDRERERFELQLENDEQLCDDLIEATRLIQAVQAIPEAVTCMPVRQPLQRSNFRSAISTAVVVATMAVLALSGTWMSASSSNIDEAVAVSRLLRVGDESEQSDVGLDEQDSEDAYASGDSELMSPEWLMTAVELEEDVPSGDPEEDDQSI